MYSKNLTEDLRLRLTSQDMDFLRQLSEQRCMSVSEVIRGIIGEYRRSLDTMTTFTELLKLAKEAKENGGLSNGDTETDLDHKL